MAKLINIVLILGIAAAIIYIIYRMILKRQTDSGVNTVLPYSDEPTSAQNSEIATIQNTSLGSGITNFNISESSPRYLKDYCIKASYNSAFTGSYVNRDMVKYILSRGCRFLDFEVYVKDSIPIIAYSSNIADPSFTYFTSLQPSLSLAGVCSTIMNNAFSSTSPNPRDPLFIHLRIKTYLPEAYDTIARILKGSLNAKLYNKKVNPDTAIEDIMGKIILIIDKTTSPNYQNYSTCSPEETTCYSMKDMINMESGSNALRIYKGDELMNQSINPPDPNVYLMRIVLPCQGFFYGVRNNDSLYFIQNYGAQVIVQAFFLNDAKITVYEELFRNYKSAFVPLQTAISYIKENQP
jgi:hypothetical protein